MYKLTQFIKASLLLLPLLLVGCNQFDSSVATDANDSSAVNSSKQVVVYSAEWCGPCHELKRELDKQGVAYTAYDIDKNEQAKEELVRLGSRALPTTVVGDEVIIGYAPQDIVAALAN